MITQVFYACSPCSAPHPGNVSLALCSPAPIFKCVLWSHSLGNELCSTDHTYAKIACMDELISQLTNLLTSYCWSKNGLIQSGHPNDKWQNTPKYENRELSTIYKKKKNRKIEQQKLLQEAPPNLIYDVLVFRLLGHHMHAERVHKLKWISHALLAKIDINGLQRAQEHQSGAVRFFMTKKTFRLILYIVC